MSDTLRYLVRINEQLESGIPEGNTDLCFYDLSQSWDGSYKGQPVLEGQYTYIITFTSELNGQPHTESQRGMVRIFR